MIKNPLLIKSKDTMRKYPITNPFKPSIKFVPLTSTIKQNKTKIKLKKLYSRILSTNSIREFKILRSK